MIPVYSVDSLRGLSIGDRTARAFGGKEPGDGAGGDFAWIDDPAMIDDNGITSVRSVSGTGGWKRSFTGPVSTLWALAKGDGIADDRAAVLAALAASDHVRLSGVHRIASDLAIPAGKVLHFDQGGMLTIDAGKSITGRIALAGPPPKQLFGGIGTLAFVIDCVGPIDIRWFGASETATDNSTAINAAIVCAASPGGGEVFVPHGTWNTTAPIVLLNGVILRGAGRVSQIHANHTGNGIENICPINSSTASNARVERLSIVCGVGGSLKAGVAQVGGTFFVACDVRVAGFKYGIVFDQSELCEIDLCDLEANVVAGVWLVNNNDFTPGAQGTYTNRISVERCQFNGGQYGIIDDGGVAHTIARNNFNTQTVACARISGTDNCLFAYNELESSTTGLISTSASLAGGGVGQNINFEIANNAFATTSHPSVSFTNGSPVTVHDNFSSTNVTAFQGVFNCYTFNAWGNLNASTGANYDALPQHGFVHDNLTFTIGPIQYTSGTAAPTTGTWNIGAVCVNSAPQSGHPMEWRCTATGTPGTWLPGPNL